MGPMGGDPCWDPWWDEDCPARPGAGLTHMHKKECSNSNHKGKCCECGMGVGQRATPDDLPLQLVQQAKPLPQMPMDQFHNATGDYREWSRPIQGYVEGNPDGPGRGDLSPAWVEWALHHDWKTP